MLTTTYAGLSDLGRQRKRNDDRWGADAAQGLYIVADGVGSTKHGDMAAELVVETLPTYVGRHFEGADPQDGQLSARLGTAVVEMCTDLHARSQTDSRLASAGTTLVTAVISGSRAVVAHLGDSRAYLFRGGQVQRLTSDHTIVQAVMDAGGLSEEEAKKHPNRSIVVRHVLMTPPAKPDVNEVDLQPGDRILLCSDGLSGVVDDSALTAILGEHPDPTAACEALVAAANEAGGPDNITAVVVDAGGSGVAAPAPTAQPTVAGPVPSVPGAQPTVASPIPPVPAAQPATAAPIPPAPPVEATMAGPIPPAPPAGPPPPGPPPGPPPPVPPAPVPPTPPAGRVPPAVIPPPGPPSSGRGRGLKLALVGLVVLLLVGAGYWWWTRPTVLKTPAGQTTKTSAQGQAPSPSAQTEQPSLPLGPPTQLPFGKLKHVRGVAVDAAGNVYVLAVKDNDVVVLKLEPGKTTPTDLPFHGLSKDVSAIAVDASGRNVYVADSHREGRLLRWDGEAREAIEVHGWQSPADALKDPHGIALDNKGNIYVADTKNNRVVRVSANPTEESSSVEVLHFTVREPSGVAVDGSGIVYVIDRGGDHSKSRLLKLFPGSDKQEEVSVAGLDDPSGIAVNPAGDIYIVDSRAKEGGKDVSDHELLKVSAGSINATLRFIGFAKPTGVAVDDKGNVYVADDDRTPVVLQQHDG